MSVPTAEKMTATDVILIAEARGFRVKLLQDDPPMPVLVGMASKVTEPLLEALRAFREEIIPILRERSTHA